MNKIKFNFLKITALLLIACTLLAGCGEKKDDGKEVGLMVDGKSFYYLSDEKLMSYKETVRALLENERPSKYDGDYDENAAPPYPDRPSVEEGYSCALFDVTGDGVPELFISLRGHSGSAGNATYDIYDITTAKVIGQVDGAMMSTLCVYYNTETDAFMRVDQFRVQGGIDYQMLHTVTLEYDSVQGGYYYKPYLEVIYETIPDYTKAEFYSGDKKLSQHQYFEKYEYLNRNCIRLVETEICVFFWIDIVSDTDDQATRAQKMADALFSSGQKFLITQQ